MISEADLKSAWRLARAIASDISIYNKDKIEEGLKNDNVFDLLEDELNEGRDMFKKKVSPEILQTKNLFERAMIDVIIAPRSSTIAPIF